MIIDSMSTSNLEYSGDDDTDRWRNGTEYLSWTWLRREKQVRDRNSDYVNDIPVLGAAEFLWNWIIATGFQWFSHTDAIETNHVLLEIRRESGGAYCEPYTTDAIKWILIIS